MPDLKFFKTPAEFRRWLSRYHAKSKELWVGFTRVEGQPGSLDLLSGPAVVVPEDGHLVDRERQEGGNRAQAPGNAHPILDQGPNHPALTRPSKSR
jgi:hypothetical protein